MITKIATKIMTDIKIIFLSLIECFCIDDVFDLDDVFGLDCIFCLDNVLGLLLPNLKIKDQLDGSLYGMIGQVSSSKNFSIL